MNIIAAIFIGIVAAEHLYILWLEMFAWTSKGPKVFSTLPKDLFPQTEIMAANQGLYNGFLSAGLTWALFIQDKAWSVNVAIFFLSCVIVAGIYGALTISRKIFLIQAVPAILSLAALLLWRS